MRDRQEFGDSRRFDPWGLVPSILALVAASITGCVGLVSWLKGNPTEEFKGNLLWAVAIIVFGALVLWGQLGGAFGDAFFDPVPIPDFTYSIENIAK